MTKKNTKLMFIPQQKFREIVFQLLYSLDAHATAEDELITLMMKELKVSKKIVRSALDIVILVQKKQEEIDAIIEKTTSSYSFERIQSVEKNILRLGLYELNYDEKIPHKVAISEAMRLARKFGTPASSAFVNAILDAIYKSTQGEKVNGEKLKESMQALLTTQNHAEDIAKSSPQLAPEG